MPRAISSQEQATKLGNTFQRLEKSVADLLGGADLSARPAEASPDRALVFEVIGPVANFVQAARNVGLEWLAEEYDSPSAEDDNDSEYIEEESTSETLLYVTMPSIAGLQRVLALWNRFIRNEPKPSDGREWWALFGYLNNVRTWSAQDRVDPAVEAYVERMLERYPERPVRLELDLWFREDEELRARARDYVDALMESVSGRVLDFATIPPICYQAALVELPGYQARMLRQYRGPLADADRVMRVKPQSLYLSGERQPIPTTLDERDPPDEPDNRRAIVALLDGYPIQNHHLLANRVDIEEVDVTGEMSPVARRFHGTAMASLILHGDLGHGEPPTDRILKIVPILAAPQGLHQECTPLERLPVAMVYRAVTALMEGLDGGPPLGNEVVIINHSVCDQEAPFARRASPWAKLLDYLSHEHKLLFVVSAGNSNSPFEIDTYVDCDDFENADAIERQLVLLRAIERAKGTRLILSPAESINSVTVGAIHEDSSTGCPAGHVDPFVPIGVTNLTSGVGLGFNRAIKPDLVEAGGRQMAMSETAEGTVSVWAREHGDAGQLTAIPDTNGGTNTKTGRSTGTSNAAALVTRAALKVADVVEELFSQDGQDWVRLPTRAVVLKALLVHSCSWGSVGKLLNNLYNGNWQRKREAISRFLGYGRPDHSRIMRGDGSRITLLADDIITPDLLHEYKIPIPRAMVGNRELRRVTMTLAWSTPTDPGSRRYRGVLAEIVDRNGKRDFWDGVGSTLQPHPFAGRRGTLQHLVLEGKKLIRSLEEGAFFVGVQARADLPLFAAAKVPYALAITLELAQPVRDDLFADVEARVRLKQRAARPRTPIRLRTRS
ncbi:MAG: S8 family peptidase [Niveispirillum sp.]|uniref:S8 family peptidase n=1 Tax=Niveispirillum sp. TaxID=1917217 RepID=UPI00403656D9